MGCLTKDEIYTEFWKNIDVELPNYDLQKMRAATMKEPRWLHFGAGNIFRMFLAGLQEQLLNDGFEQTGIVAAECFDRQIIRDIYLPCDNLTLAVTMKASGGMRRQVIGSIADACECGRGKQAAWEHLMQIAGSASLQMISFTITEKGYKLRDKDGEWTAEVKKAMTEGPGSSDHIMVNAASLLYCRFKAGRLPIAMVSMDNCASNGDILFRSIYEIAGQWADSGLVEKEFLDYISSPEQVAFPWSMIDKITPRPSEAVREHLAQQGIEKMNIICTEKQTFIAPFVNAEETQYLVIEDTFPNGRPSLERAGVLFTDRETVSKAETMKVTTCLNPLHTALAVFGCLLGYDLISDEMKDPQLKGLIRKIGYDEALPEVVDPGIIDPRLFLDQVIQVRFPNPFILDTPQRIATDTSQKIPIRFGRTIQSCCRKGKDASQLTGILLVLAGWLRYLTGIDDTGTPFELSPDPLLGELQPVVKKAVEHTDCLDQLLRDEALFGVDLIKAGAGERIKTLFGEMTKGSGAVKGTLKKYIKGDK